MTRMCFLFLKSLRSVVKLTSEEMSKTVQRVLILSTKRRMLKRIMKFNVWRRYTRFEKRKFQEPLHHSRTTDVVCHLQHSYLYNKHALQSPIVGKNHKLVLRFLYSVQIHAEYVVIIKIPVRY